MFGIIFGLGLGALLGISVGPFVFPEITKPKDYRFLDEEADKDDEFEVPQPGTPISNEMRAMLQFAEPWTTSPDYQRMYMINRCIKVLWPTLKEAMVKEVFKQAKAQLHEHVFSKFPFVEELVLGTEGMRQDGALDFSTWIKDKHFDIGDVPLRLGGIKTYNTGEDEVIVETSVLWGSNAKLHVGVFLRFGPFRLYIPIELESVQLKIDARVTLKPLIDVIPFFGGVSISLLKVPHVDFKLSLMRGIDIMALPLIKDGVRMVLKYVLESMLIIPNHLTIPLFPNFGVPPAAKGALNVKLLRVRGIHKGDSVYCEMEVRRGRPVCSNTAVVSGKEAEFNEEFNLIIDDYETQSLKILLYNDDLGWNDTLLSGGELAFGRMEGERMDEKGNIVDGFELANFMKVPMTETLVEVELGRTSSTGLVKSMSKSAASMLRPGSTAISTAGTTLKAGTVILQVMFIPFFQPTFDDEEEERVGGLRRKAAVLPTNRAVNTNVPAKLKGVLTVTLIRCLNLPGEDINSYVRLLVSDDEKDQLQKSTVVFSQASPRWGQKFDFVMVTAGSTLYLNVYKKSSLTSNVLGTINLFSHKKKEEDKDKSLGKLQVPVKDVVRNGYLKDIWTLQDAEKGQIELALSWQTCYISDMEEGM
ncbi:hypothetical protein CEUSTIGMA_g11645.t1 [Chlamydomonas eustigma]|uniref:C2 domain-containing protein n=1 Tax=Chlamydomonas eustigma TaxID=1157962 RepID=A0A250XMU0_9CHLO|nr:hypothetical protein CEUSTIGMA_g11645.t1 [Chlamydomonas eustigma]|eukprot:GAX84222.1 hypothetical protein CEUSTIGMA_g11645.t1 [Chlamydomonas eustigma]